MVRGWRAVLPAAPRRARLPPGSRRGPARDPPPGKNDLPEIISRLGNKIHFLHLRNVARQPDGSFYEADHLTGSVDMYAVMKAIINDQMARKNAGRSDIAIPMRPDHGHKLLDDFNYDTYPGYSVIGRLKGLAELRGLEMGIKRILYDEQ